MLRALPTPILLDIAILLTAFCWRLRFFIADRKTYFFAPLAIACFVCLFGYSVESLGAPAWAVVAAPVPLDILLLWYVGIECYQQALALDPITPTHMPRGRLVRASELLWRPRAISVLEDCAQERDPGSPSLAKPIPCWPL
jgi:hypothetical protein